MSVSLVLSRMSSHACVLTWQSNWHVSMKAWLCPFQSKKFRCHWLAVLLEFWLNEFYILKRPRARNALTGLVKQTRISSAYNEITWDISYTEILWTSGLDVYKSRQQRVQNRSFMSRDKKNSVSKSSWHVIKWQAETLLGAFKKRLTVKAQTQHHFSTFALLTLNQRQNWRKWTVARQGCSNGVTSETVLFKLPPRYYLGLNHLSVLTLAGHIYTVWSPLPRHLNFTLIPKGDIEASGSLHRWCMCFLVCFHSDQTESFKGLSLPQDEDRFGSGSVMHSQRWEILKHAFPPPGTEHHKFDYCLYYHRSRPRMLLEVKPAQGKTSQPAVTEAHQERRLKRWRDKEDVFSSDCFTTTLTNVGATFFNVPPVMRGTV